MTRKCSLNTRGQKAASVFFALLLCCGRLSAQQGDGAKSWTVASMPFSLSQSRDFSNSERSIARELPALILGQLSGGLERVPDNQEVSDRAVRELRKKRQSLFLQLSRETQARDTLALGGYGEREFQKLVADAEKKMRDIQDSIEANLDEADEVMKSLARLGGADKPSDSPFERVGVYRDDAAALFEYTTRGGEPVDYAAIDMESYSFSERVVSAGINGLMTGAVTMYGSYVLCSVELYVYPGARMICAASEIGRAGNLAMIARSIAQQLQPQIIFELPVKLSFSVSPPEAADTARLILDDIIYSPVPESVIVSAGVHSVLFSASGFVPAGTSYAFVDSGEFDVSVTLEAARAGNAFLKISDFPSGVFYLNATHAGEKNAGAGTAALEINGRAVLGQFITDDGSAALFYVPENILADGNVLSLDASPFDRSEVIEKRRRRMYTAYSIFIISLVPFFYTYGTYTSEAAAYNSLRGSYGDVSGWQVASTVTMGITIGAAGYLVFELVRYLTAADTVLPATAVKGSSAKKNGWWRKFLLGVK